MNNLKRIGEGSAFLEDFEASCVDASAEQRAELFGPAIRAIHDSIASEGQTDAPAPTSDLDFHFVVRLSDRPLPTRAPPPAAHRRRHSRPHHHRHGEHSPTAPVLTALYM